MGARTIRRGVVRTAASVVLAATVAAALLPSSGCTFWGSAPYEHTVRQTVAGVAAPAAVEIDTRNGAVTVRRATGPDLTIVAEVRARTQERADTMRLLADRDGDRLRIHVEPADGVWQNNEGASLTVDLPASQAPAKLAIKTGNGALTISDFNGDIDARTSNGAIKITGGPRTVKAGTSNGRVEVGGAAGRVDADSSNGAITIRLAADNPGPVTLETSNGAVALHAGRGFKGTLDAGTSNGSLDMPTGDGITVHKLSKRSASLDFGGSGSSSIKTSNGSITVRLEK